MDCLAPFVVRQPDDRRLRDRWMFAQAVLGLERIDVLAARNDHLPGATDQKQIAIRVKIPRIAGKVESALQDLGRLVGPVPVPLHGKGAGPRGADLVDKLCDHAGIRAGTDPREGQMKLGPVRNDQEVRRQGKPDTCARRCPVHGRDHRHGDFSQQRDDLIDAGLHRAFDRRATQKYLLRVKICARAKAAARSCEDNGPMAQIGAFLDERGQQLPAHLG